ncbi:WD repeat-containing and planar cell polarity effector protein fritz homolog isoform X3 [Ornithorhynchus anatinus]|uniref:WD repeat-containing and planar cell polarity effector protein fritz homolog isoform X3 n=1 Tax=Ornithorhynchus anatinus TaxID=9258 RepID=UPI0004540EC5|nr:WD repeat-containing and planar cell polarity effector protein fritz homolog isoform X3 [Ornithorhynchus anatinus]
MSFCLTELHLWSLKNTLHIGDGDIGVYQYYDKKETVSPTKFSYLEDKQQLAESRDYPWILKNKRPEKLRDTLKELEELMQNSQCVLSKWKNKYFCQISYHEIPGPVSRRIERHLAINSVQDMVICWWPTASDDAWPWSPISSEKDRANLLLLGCAYGRLEVLSYIRTEWNPLDASFSTNQPYQVHTVEHSISVDKEPMADSCVYECVRNKIQCVAITRIPLRSKAISCCRNISEDKLILGCEDSSVILYEANRRVTLLAQAELLPTLLSCHPEGALILVGSSQGELQIFDTALSPIKVQLLAEDCSPEDTLQFSRRFEVSHSLVQIQWTVPQCANDVDIHDLLFLRFDKGPIGVLLFKLGVFTGGRLGLVEIINQYIRYDEIDEAINILSTMSWDAMGHQCFISMSAIVNHLLRQKFTLEREAQLEASLGTFYAPTRPLSDTAVLEFRDPISRYARRFFHYLLRHHRFEKAFLLAMDIGARDLFMDIHYLALDKGELALAEVAKKRANDIDAESITTGVELLGPLDGGDRLTAAFDGLSLSPQAEEKHPENFPLPGPDGSPISHCPSLDSSFQRPTYSRQVADKEHEPEKDIYASSLMDKRGVGWNSGGDLGEDYLEEETGDGGSLRMVHFGLV